MARGTWASRSCSQLSLTNPYACKRTLCDMNGLLGWGYSYSGGDVAPTRLRVLNWAQTQQSPPSCVDPRAVLSVSPSIGRSHPVLSKSMGHPGNGSCPMNISLGLVLAVKDLQSVAHCAVSLPLPLSVERQNDL